MMRFFISLLFGGWQKQVEQPSLEEDIEFFEIIDD